MIERVEAPRLFKIPMCLVCSNIIIKSVEQEVMIAIKVITIKIKITLESKRSNHAKRLGSISSIV